MTFQDLVKTAFGNLGRHKVRTALSAVGVTVGILTIVTMLSLGIGVQREIIRVFKGVGLEMVRIQPVTEERTVFTQFTEPRRTVLITQALVDEVRGRDDVIEVTPVIYVPQSARVSCKMGERMVEVRVHESEWAPDEPFTKPPELAAGEELAPQTPGGIVVSAGVLRGLGYAWDEFDALIGQEVALLVEAPRGEEQSFSLRLTGVVKTGYEDGVGDEESEGDYVATEFGPAYVVVGVDDALAIKAWWYNDPDILAHEGYDALLLKAKTVNSAVQIVEQFETQGFEVESLRSILDMINKAMVILQTMLGSVGGLALFVATIGIANTMIMSVYERTREIGILRAVGASPGDVRLLFVVEAALIGLLGGVTGLVGGWLLGIGLNEGMLAYLRWQEVPISGSFFVVSGWLIVLALAFATVVGLLAGLYPAARAARLDPLEALRYE